MLLLVLFDLTLILVAHELHDKPHTTAHHYRKKNKDADDVVRGDRRIGNFCSMRNTQHTQ